jgi:hypothetical protein
MSPIPINASMGAAVADRLHRHALAVAAVAQVAAGRRAGRAWAATGLASGCSPCSSVFGPCSTSAVAPATAPGWPGRGRADRAVAGVAGGGLVLLKMLPFDNKSEFQVVVDMPAGSPVEQTAGVLRELGAYLATVPEVTDYQAYAGTAAPINFNGLVRQYDLRASSELGDLQVNLVDKHHRSEQSHAIATRLRPALQAIGERLGAKVKVVEVPPGRRCWRRWWPRSTAPSRRPARRGAAGARHLRQDRFGGRCRRFLDRRGAAHPGAGGSAKAAPPASARPPSWPRCAPAWPARP